MLSFGVRGGEAALIFAGDFRDDAVAGQMGPVSIAAGTNVSEGGSGLKTKSWKSAGDLPLLVRLIADCIASVADDWPRDGQDRRQGYDQAHAAEKLWIGVAGKFHAREGPKQEHQGKGTDVAEFDKNQGVHGQRRNRWKHDQPHFWGNRPP